MGEIMKGDLLKREVAVIFTFVLKDMEKVAFSNSLFYLLSFPACPESFCCLIPIPISIVIAIVFQKY